MKKLLLLLLLSPVALLAQEKGATQIFVHNDKDAKSNFDYVSLSLIENDYGIEDRDSSLGVINIKQFNYKNLIIKLTVFCKDSVIRISGETSMGMSSNLFGSIVEARFFKIELAGKKGSLARRPFDGMDEFARSLGTDISYK